MKKRDQLQGMQFKYLTVIEPTHSLRGDLYWRCKCKCGKETIVRGSKLKCGMTKSCGCLQRELASSKSYIHGLSRTKIYRIWRGMMSRCNNPRFTFYKHYGGRGISVDKEWEEKFLSFYDWSMSNGYKEGLEIDRINNDGNYGPSNCRWVTRKDQTNNTRRNVFIEFNGMKLTITQWSEKTGIHKSTLTYRYRQGWDAKKILEEVETNVQ